MFFFFKDTATTEIYTLSLHDALPILVHLRARAHLDRGLQCRLRDRRNPPRVEAVRALFGFRDRKSTRLNSSHANISYAVFCLKKKKIYSTSPLPRTSPFHTFFRRFDL